LEIGELLERAKVRLKVQSDRALARALAVDPTSFIHWRRGDEYPTDERMIRICAAADVPVAHGLLYLNIWRSSGDARATYRVICQELDSNAVLSAEDKKPRERTRIKSSPSP
jgi:hypothetical protein